MQERACSLLVQFMNALVFLVDYGTIKISKDVADTIMKLLQNGSISVFVYCYMKS